MARRTALLLTTLLTLTACQVPVAPGDGPGEPREQEREVKLTRRPAPTPAGQGDAKADAEASAAYDMLVAPSGGHLEFKGSVAVDADYLLSIGRGKLIGHAGGNLIGHAGGNIIAAGGGNLIGHAGGNIIPSGGGNLIGHAGGNLIGKRKYRALAESELALGEVLKAAEMEIRVFSMATCQQLPLGVDKDGAAIMSAYSNLTGDFTLYLPESAKGRNVLVVATVPGAEGERFTYPMTWYAGDAEAVTIDEDTALATEFLREAFVSRLERLFIDSNRGMNDETGETANGFEDLLPPALAPLAEPIGKRLTEAARDYTAADVPSEERRAAAKRAADALLSDIKLGEMQNKSRTASIVSDLTALLKESRVLAGQRMVAHAAEAGPGHERDYFSHQDFLLEANAKQAAAGLPPYHVDRPSDLFAFALKHVVANYDRNSQGALGRIAENIGLPVEATKARLDDIMDGMLYAIAFKMLSDTAAVDAAVDAIGCKP